MGFPTLVLAVCAGLALVAAAAELWALVFGERDTVPENDEAVKASYRRASQFVKVPKEQPETR